MCDRLKPKRALISVSDKQGIVEFVRGLQGLGVRVISTGGTAKVLKGAGLEIKEVSEVTGFPEILDGRVKTLHPKIQGGILARRDNVQMGELKKLGIQPIDMVVVNLYPFERTVARERVSLSEALEQIDIGGVTLIRAGAKNFRDVCVVTDPKRYPEILAELRERKELSEDTLRELAVEAFAHTSTYDTIIHNYLGAGKFLPKLLLSYDKAMDLRYGENPHQSAAFYRERKITEPCIPNAKQLWGKKLSFNNILDLDAALELIKAFEEPTVATIKHTNPAGIASHPNLYQAWKYAWECDPVSAFGGIIASNRKLSAGIAEDIGKVFVEAVIAPSYQEEALEILQHKKNLRILETGELKPTHPGLDMKKVTGGLLVQEKDVKVLSKDMLRTVSEIKPTEAELEGLMFGWRVVKYVKSNAILFCKGKRTIGIGAGQMSRVDAVKIAAMKSREDTTNAVMASDAFFPFRDGIDEGAKAGVAAVIEPGGSVRDKEVIQAANEHGIALVFTGMRTFKH